MVVDTIVTRDSMALNVHQTSCYRISEIKFQTCVLNYYQCDDGVGNGKDQCLISNASLLDDTTI